MVEAVAGSAVMIVFVLLLRRFFSEKFSRRFLYGLWGFVLLRLTVFTLFSIPREFFFYKGTMQKTGAGPVPAVVQDAGPDTLPVFARRILFFVWMAGMVTVLLLQIVPAIKMWLCLKKERLAVTEKKKTELTVYAVSGLSTPFLFGSAIYCPIGLLAEKEKMRLVLWHETVHFKHLDPVWNVLRLAVTAVYWFHPLVWVAGFVSKQDAEYACDEAVAADMTKEELQYYCKVLLEVASGHSFRKRGLRLETGMVSGQLSERIKSMLRTGKPKKAATVLAACAMVVFTVYSLPVRMAEGSGLGADAATGDGQAASGVVAVATPTVGDGQAASGVVAIATPKAGLLGGFAPIATPVPELKEGIASVVTQMPVLSEAFMATVTLKPVAEPIPSVVVRRTEPENPS